MPPIELIATGLAALYEEYMENWFSRSVRRRSHSDALWHAKVSVQSSLSGELTAQCGDPDAWVDLAERLAAQFDRIESRQLDNEQLKEISAIVADDDVEAHCPVTAGVPSADELEEARATVISVAWACYQYARESSA
jgi:hypothetical protein